MAAYSIIEMERICFSYEGVRSRNILDNADIRIDEGDYVTVTGPSGCGKSTFLRLLCRLEEPTSGKIRYKGRAYLEMDPAELRSRIHYVQQVPVLNPGSIRENLLLPFAFHVNRDKPIPDRGEMKKWLERLGLDECSPEDSALSLSVGQKQRVCLIRSILLRPDIMLLDEPTSALDQKSADIVLETTRDINNRLNTTVIMVSHDRTMTGETLKKRIEIKNGKVVLK